MNINSNPARAAFTILLLTLTMFLSARSSQAQQSYGSWTELLAIRENGVQVTIGPSPNGGDVDFWLCTPGVATYHRSWGWSVANHVVTVYSDTPRLKAFVVVNMLTNEGHADFIFDGAIYSISDLNVRDFSAACAGSEDLGESHAPIPGSDPGPAPLAVTIGGCPGSGYAPLAVNFIATTNKGPATYSWSDNGVPFGAGSSVVLTYATAGTHVVKVTATYGNEVAQAIVALVIEPPKSNPGNNPPKGGPKPPKKK